MEIFTCLQLENAPAITEVQHTMKGGGGTLGSLNSCRNRDVPVLASSINNTVKYIAHFV